MELPCLFHGKRVLLNEHALRRLRERRISASDVCRVFEKYTLECVNSKTRLRVLVEEESGVAVVFKEHAGLIEVVTVFKGMKGKKLLSRLLRGRWVCTHR